LAGVPVDRHDPAETLLAQIKTDLADLETATEAKDKDQVITVRQSALTAIGDLEALMVTDFPFEIPDQYANLPQLKGRATVAMETSQGPLTIVVDGYSAPINGGNFVDLVQRKFYDGLPFIRSEDFFVTQAGDPDGPEVGFIDPKTKAYRAIPLEIKVREDEAPIYGMTLEEAGLYLPELALPFNAYGAIALARPETEPNGGSSQFFFFKFDTELTPPGFNLMDGRYSVFGYVVEGKETLNKLSEGDKIISAKVVEGADNLING
jgi:peptidylprolyl isomerase